MSFLNSIPLWGTLAALGVATPILIHLWSRRQKMEINWAAMELLKKAMVARSRQVRMEDRMLMILRCLALFLIAFALLRPLLKNVSSAKTSGGTGVVIAIDASYSMGHGEPARFEQAMIKVREILSTIKEGDQVSIVLMSSKPQVLFRSTGYDPGSFNAGLEKSAKVSSHPLNLERNLELLLELSKELKSPTKECYIITDAQVNDWQALSNQARTSFEELGEAAKVVVSPLKNSSYSNLALTDFNYSAGSLQKGESARFSASITNTGNELQQGASVEFFVNGKLKAREEIGPLQAGEKKLASFFTNFENSGDIALTAKLSKDDLKEDNERHIIANVRPSIKILCIDGDAADSDPKDAKGAFFAIRALSLKHSKETAPIKVTHVDMDSMYGEKLNNYDIVMMFNVGDINKDFSMRIKKFVDNGGGLMTFLGDKVKAEDYNTKFAVNNTPILPVKLLEIKNSDEGKTGWKIIPSKGDNALTQLVRKLPADLVSATKFKTYFKLEKSKGSKNILSLDNGAPLIVGSSDNRVLVFTSSGDRSWNDFPVNPLYMILLQQTATMLSSDPELSEGIVGEEMKIQLPGRLMGDDAKLTYPTGEVEPVKVTVVNEETVVVLTPEAPGVYSISPKAGKSGATVALNVNTEESDVRTGSADSLEKWLGDLPVEVTKDSTADAVASNRKGRDISSILLILGTICFFAQGLLSNRMSRQKHAADGGMIETLQKNRVAASRRS